MRNPYYGLSFTTTITPASTNIPLMLANIDAVVGDVGMTFENPDDASIPLNIGLIDADIGDVSLSFAPPEAETILLNTGRLDAIIDDVPMTLAPLDAGTLVLHTGQVDAQIADVPLELTPPDADTLSLHPGRVDAQVADVEMELLPPDAEGIVLNTGRVDATVFDVTLEINPPDAETITLNTGIVDTIVADVDFELNPPDAETIGLNTAIVDTQVADTVLELNPPDAENITLNTALIDADVGDVSIEYLPPDAESITLNPARIDAEIADAELAFLPPDADSIGLNPARIDALIADVPMDFSVEAAGFGANGLLKGSVFNYGRFDAVGTVMLWLKVPTDVAEDRRITFAANRGSTPRIQFFVQSDIAGTQTLGIETDDGTVTEAFFFEPTNSIFDGEKHFVAYRGNGSSYDIFIDGLPAVGVAAGVNSGKWFNIQLSAGLLFNQLQIGGFAEPGQNVELFYGTIDELTYVAQALSDAEILSLYNNGDGATLPEQSGASWWSDVRSAYELAKDDNRDWGDDYRGIFNLFEDPAGFLVPGDTLVNGGWTP